MLLEYSSQGGDFAILGQTTASSMMESNEYGSLKTGYASTLNSRVNGLAMLIARNLHFHEVNSRGGRRECP